MKQVTCDLCHTPFEYGDATSLTDGVYRTVRVGITNVRVCLDVKAHLADKGDHADICPACRQKVIESVLYGNTSIPGHQASRNNLRGLRDEGPGPEGERLRCHA